MSTQTDETGQPLPEVPPGPESGSEPQRLSQDGQSDHGGDNDPETFPREYVENLRKENADARVRAKAADDLARRLHLELVRATGRLADPTDLPFSEHHLEDVSILDAALDDLIGRKPHLASRRPTGDIGQGATATTDTVDLAGILRSRAG